MVIKTISATNIFSWKTFQLDFQPEKQKRILFVGKTGSGKTAIFEMVCLALYGKILRGSVKDIIHHGENDAALSVVFYDKEKNATLHIHRTFKSTANGTASVCYQTAKKKDTRTGIKACNQYIVQCIGITYELFLTSVYFSQYTMNRFLDETDANQKSILEQLFGNINISELRNRVLGQIKQYERKQQELEEQMYEQRMFMKTCETLGHKDPNNLKQSLHKLEEQKQKLNDRYEIVKEQLQHVQLRDRSVKKELDVFLKDMQNYRKMLSVKEGTCPFCQTTLNEQAIKQITKTYTKKLREATTNHQHYEKQYKEIQKQQLDIEESLDNLQDKIFLIEKKIAQYVNDLRMIDKIKTKHTASIDMSQLQRKSSDLQEKNKILHIWGEALNKRGFLSFLLSRTLPLIQERINFYLQKLLDTTLELSINSETGRFQYVIKSKVVGKLKSSGQARVIDFSLHLAIHDVIEKISGVKVNFLLLDEAPEHLDKELSEQMAMVIAQLPYQQILVISHDEAWRQYFPYVYKITRTSKNTSKIRVFEGMGI